MVEGVREMPRSGYETAVRFAEALTDKFAYVEEAPYGGAVFTVSKGRAYHRIVLTDRKGDHRSVHAFVDNEGRLIKAASWSKPQQDKAGLAVRYDLSTPAGFLEALDRATWSGGYLYK